jgi:hypothetical protein
VYIMKCCAAVANLVSSGQQLHAMDDITGMLGALSIFSTIRPLARCLVASEVFLPKVGLLFCKHAHLPLRCCAKVRLTSTGADHKPLTDSRSGNCRRPVTAANLRGRRCWAQRSAWRS